MSVLTVEGTLQPRGYEQITGLSAVKGLTPPAGARLALVQATGTAVRWRDDGTNPSTTVGMQLAAGQSHWYCGDLAAVRFLEESASAKLNVSYYSG